MEPPFIRPIYHFSAVRKAANRKDPHLIVELRVAFLDSADRSLAALARARDGKAWRAAAWRLKSLAASFGATRLMALAGQALQADEPDAALLGKLRRMIARL